MDLPPLLPVFSTVSPTRFRVVSLLLSEAKLSFGALTLLLQICPLVFDIRVSSHAVGPLTHPLVSLLGPHMLFQENFRPIVYLSASPSVGV